MQEKYVNMQDDYIYMRDNYVDVQVSNLLENLILIWINFLTYGIV